MIPLKILILIFLLLPFAAGAAENDDASLAQVRSAIAMQQAAGALQAAMAGLQKATPAVAPAQPVSAPMATPAANPPSSIMAEVRDGLVSLAALLIPALAGLGLTWMRGHLKIMQDAAMNDSITQSANGFAGLLVQAIQRRGGSLSTLSPHSPEVAPLAASLISSYPQFTSALGMSSEKAGFVILKEAAKIVSSVPDAAPVVAPAEPQSAVPVTQSVATDHQDIVQTPVAVQPMTTPKAVPPSWSSAISPS